MPELPFNKYSAWYSDLSPEKYKAYWSNVCISSPQIGSVTHSVSLGRHPPVVLFLWRGGGMSVLCVLSVDYDSLKPMKIGMRRK